MHLQIGDTVLLQSQPVVSVQQSGIWSFVHLFDINVYCC